MILSVSQLVAGSPKQALSAVRALTFTQTI